MHAASGLYSNTYFDAQVCMFAKQVFIDLWLDSVYWRVKLERNIERTSDKAAPNKLNNHHEKFTKERNER